MAISFVAFAESSTATGNEPSGTQQGDVLVAAYASAHGDGSPHSGPSGWTQVGSQRTDGSWRNSVWRIVRGASAPALTWTGAGAAQRVNIAGYRGVDNTNPVNASANTDSSKLSPSVTTTLADCWLASLYLDMAQTSSVPSGMSNRSGAAFWTQIADEALGAAGATGTREWGTSVGGGSPHSVYSLALSPAGATTIVEARLQAAARGMANGMNRGMR